MGTAIVVILLLIVLNGLFSMAETALVSARRVRLEQAAERGDKRAAAALALHLEPTRFLSTVQVGITLIAILSGAFGEASLAGHRQSRLERIPALAPYPSTLASTVVVLVITYLSVVLGELVPKRLALANAERISAWSAWPMSVVSRVAAPAVWLLSASTNLLMGAFGRRKAEEHAVTEEDVRGMIEQAASTGAVLELEQRLIERVFRLGDRRVKSLMVPRTEVEWLEIDAPPAEVRRTVARSAHSHFPVCRGGLDKVVGVVHLKDIVKRSLTAGTIALTAVMERPMFVPETAPALTLLETMRTSGRRLALVVDEWGAFVGLVTLSDIVERIVGDVLEVGEGEPEVSRREDGSWLLDGGVPLDRLWDIMGLREEPAEVAGSDVETIGGLVSWRLGHIPTPGEAFDLAGWRFEVVDMDRQRVDKVLLMKPASGDDNGGQEPD